MRFGKNKSKKLRMIQGFYWIKLEGKKKSSLARLKN
jgi:hypothetical protein